MHDTGPLVPPKEGGPIAQLIAAIQDAKAYSDMYLTSLIDQEEQQHSNTSIIGDATVDNVSRNKRARTDEL
jgi:hypothetical protein